MSGTYNEIDFRTGKTSEKTFEIKSWGSPLPHVMEIGDVTMSYQDFCEIIEYFLTNTHLEDENDPRIKLIEYVRNLQTEERVCGSILGKPITGKYLQTKK